MAANRAIASAIENCYDAAFEFGRWPAALQKLANALGATSCVIRACDDTHPFRSDQRKRTTPTPDSTEHAEFSALWFEKIEGAPDPRCERLRLLAKPATCFTIEDELTTPEERRFLPYYQEIARPGHREWWAAVYFMVKKHKWFLSMFRDARSGAFDLSEADHFLRVVPELTQIISLAEKIWEISLDPTLAILDQFNFGATLLDHRGCLKRCNEHADALFGSGLVVRHGRVHAADRESDTRLQRMIGAAVSSALNGAIPVEPEVIARDGSFWLLAEVVPMTSFVRDLFSGGDLLLYFTVLVGDRPLSAQLLGQAFQLTAAEARLAVSLTAGDGVDAASARLAIGRETARTQLRAILAKTGTHRQAELTALLSRLPSRH
ncbi:MULTISPECIES: helix-turn-helix transcriptional regulator [unclassified Mesorhizobium]|uniref:helix-turn-helix transcriptional regulator n=1 Tax=unclassified Mesorhizobium TaxID=325217 RepID=UPI001091D55D|nr:MULTISPECIES: helix-turn-helix transcriptional regulator [unclassified Mesorhizobium]TGP93950.1 helix-turn-helix transcriptional regulator [Mesorhizobium sp. M8A.F.Ca.ET.218.01.1.1]TGT18246.1 helix-turn-helix transcriptional regulator [Mesorhizobium sp. M8A.F.Ca.ET.213.01.1.1]